jgi:hypothetical protein
MEKTDQWKMKTLIIGGLVGLAAGLLGAYILVQSADKAEEHPQLSTGDGVKVGLGVLGVLRLVSEMGRK